MPGYKIPPKPDPKNLFKPGQSGNPGGMARGKKISTWMVELGQSPKVLTESQVEALPYNGKVAWARLKRAAKLDAGSEGERSAEILLDRTEGGVDKKTTLTVRGDVSALPIQTQKELAASFSANLEEPEPTEE